MEKLNFEEFQEIITKKVQTKLDEKITVRVTDVTKNNGVILKGMTFTGEGETISPTIYLEQYYDEYQMGRSWSEIVDRIIDTFRFGSKNNLFNVEAFLDFEKAKEHIAFKLVNYEKNEKLLETIPHKKFLDMAVVYYYLLNNDEFENATILIYNNHLERWDVDVDTLDKIAKENTPKLLEFELRPIAEVLNELLQKKGFPEVCMPEEESDEFGMYVLSNSSKVFGAASILYPDVLKNFAEKLGRDLYILPSSVHEVILLPKRSETEWETLQEMVKEVNATQLEEVEILSDSVYSYTKKDDCLLPAWEVV